MPAKSTLPARHYHIGIATGGAALVGKGCSRAPESRRSSPAASLCGDARSHQPETEHVTRTLQKNIRVLPDQWDRIEAAANERDLTANQLLVELAMEALDRREWPQTEAQLQVARASLFAAQAIALDMIAAGRQNQVDKIRDYVATIVPNLVPEPVVAEEAAAVKSDSSKENS